jgi:hypothetical protein
VEMADPTGVPQEVQNALSPVIAVPHLVQKLAMVLSLSHGCEQVTTEPTRGTGVA